ncbi:hypothetical protein DRF67_13430 [Chryseobacterium pennipullorum]|uniref:Uncharacterized protein n=1 Tax=Chryseobacterium pennipullorum TaxID=2258963 RepID=A0A3D9B0Q3_9FLAO|nr:hypothetical protein DRF67_13430 [Chryseobacterium pennipullorum]
MTFYHEKDINKDNKKFYSTAYEYWIYNRPYYNQQPKTSAFKTQSINIIILYYNLYYFHNTLNTHNFAE